MTKSIIVRTSATEFLRSAALAVHTVNATKAGKVRSVREYVNTETGEVIPAEQLSIPAVDLREKLPARSEALASLRIEVREFAVFVLQFANKRRGITPGINTLCQWYAGLSGRAPRNIRRYIAPLTKAGILAGESLLGPLFQRTGGKAKDSLGEEFHAWRIYMRMLGERQALCGSAPQPAPAELIREEVARLDEELAAEQAAWSETLAMQAAERATRDAIDNAKKGAHSMRPPQLGLLHAT